MIAYMMILMNYYCARILKYEGKVYIDHQR